MAEGSKAYKGLAVPLYGESEIKQSTAASDILTLTAISGATGDFLVCQTAGGGEVFVVAADGQLTVGSTVTISAQTTAIGVERFSLGTAGAPTTTPTTGIAKGDMFVVWKSATVPVLGMCVSTATKLVQYIAGFTAATLGIAST